MQVIDLITLALKDIGALASGETPDADQAAEGLQIANLILDQWSNEPYMNFYKVEVIQTSIGGLGTQWTIGKGGNGTTWINADRPLNINSAFVRVAGIDYPIAIIHYEEYELIGLKQLNGPWPRALYYQPTEPLGTINLWPNPQSGDLHLFVDQVFSNFATVNDTLVFPQGYITALRWNLAMQMIPMYGRIDPTHVQMIALNAQQGQGYLKRTNMTPQQPVRFDVPGNRGVKDAGFIMHGGFI